MHKSELVHARRKGGLGRRYPRQILDITAERAIGLKYTNDRVGYCRHGREHAHVTCRDVDGSAGKLSST